MKRLEGRHGGCTCWQSHARIVGVKPLRMTVGFTNQAYCHPRPLSAQVAALVSTPLADQVGGVLMKTLPRVAEMALHVLAYNLTPS